MQKSTKTVAEAARERAVDQSRSSPSVLLKRGVTS